MRVDQRFGVRRPGDHERAVGGEPVVHHRRDVDDRDVGGGELPAEFRPVVEHVVGCRVRGVRGGQGCDDPTVRGTVLRVHDTRARVRPVDDAMASGRQKCVHERLAVREDRPVVRRGAVALPRRRVEHDDPVIGRVRKSPGVVVGLRPPDLDRAVVEVVVPQHPAQPLTSGSTRDERVVVRLVLIRGHVHLVGLAVVDEHVPSAPVPEHLEVARVLVDVQHDADVLLGDEALEIAHGRHERDRWRVFGQESARTGGDAAQDHDGPGLRQLGERLVPLADLVHVHGAVGEVHGHAVVVRRVRRLRRDRAADFADGRPVADRLAQQRRGLLRIRDDTHVLQDTDGAP